MEKSAIVIPQLAGKPLGGAQRSRAEALSLPKDQESAIYASGAAVK
jgi:hypothetical protein